MSHNLFRKNRGSRIRRPFTVRINEDASAQTPTWDIVMAQNISESGILLNFDHYLAPGSWVQFKIKLSSGADVECDGEVVRNVMGSSPGCGIPELPVCGIAAVFRNIAPEDEALLHELIEQCLAEEGPAQESEDSLADRPDETLRAKRIDRSYFTRILTDAGGEWEIVSVRDISESGILFNYGGVLKVGSELSLSIRIPFSSTPAMCKGEVVRISDETRPTATMKRYAVGVSFSEMDEENRTGLREQGDRFGHG